MPLIKAVISSLIFHLALSGLMFFTAARLDQKPPQTVEITLYPEGEILRALTPKKKEGQAVRKVLLPEKLKRVEDETLARFLSEKKQRVIEETKAAKSGITVNRNNQGESLQSNRLEQKNSDRIAQSKTEDGYRSMDITKNSQEMNEFNGGISTIGDSLPKDVKIGSMTALNTDRYLFYTFYERMNDLTYHRWESKVSKFFSQVDHEFLMQIKNITWVSHIEFLLDKNGFVQKALIMKPSGIPGLDTAATNAFIETKVFPNPPAEMVQEDGYIHIRYSFEVSPPSSGYDN